METNQIMTENPPKTEYVDSLEEVRKRWKIAWILFLIFFIITSSEFLSYLFLNYDDPTGPYAIPILILGLLRIVSWIGLIIHLAYFGYKFTNKKLWLLNGIFGVLVMWQISPLIGFLLIYLQKQKRIKELTGSPAVPVNS